MQLSKLVLPIIGAGAVGYGVLTQVDRDASGAIVGAGDVDAFDIRMGDCFNDQGAASEEIEISSVEGVPCTEPHDNEVFAVFNLSLNQFPGDDAIPQVAFDACLERFEPFVGRDYKSSSLDIFPIYPTREGWDEMNDREVVCAVFDLEFKQLSGSMRGSQI